MFQLISMDFLHFVFLLFLHRKLWGFFFLLLPVQMRSVWKIRGQVLINIIVNPGKL